MPSIFNSSGRCRISFSAQMVSSASCSAHVASWFHTLRRSSNGKGASVPTGETEFQFHSAGFNFHSIAYEWLVVSGPKAQYKGTGTINGAGSFKFLLTVTDGQVAGGGGVDKFRLKVTDGSAVVYDNVMGAPDDLTTANPQAISSGSIVIHK